MRNPILIGGLGLLSIISIVWILVYRPTAEVIVPKQTELSAQEELAEPFEQITAILQDSTVDTPYIEETQKLIQDIKSIINESSVDNSAPDRNSISAPVERDFEQLLRSEYQKLGLSYDEEKARIDAELQKPTTDPELIRLKREIEQGFQYEDDENEF